MRNFLTLFNKEILGQWRNKKIIIITAIFLFVAVSSPITAKLIPQFLKNLPNGISVQIPEPTFNDAIDQFMKNTAQLAVLFLIFVAAGAIVEEKSKKTLELLLVKPVTRTRFVITKYASYFFTVKTTFLSGAMIFYLYTVSIFGHFSFLNFLILTVLSLVYILSVISLSIFAGVLAKNTTTAGGIGLLGYVILVILGSLEKTAKYTPGYIFNHYKDLMANGWNNAFIPSTLTAIALITVLICLTILMFRDQEIEK